MTSLLAVLIDGSIYASWLFLVAAGLTVIYG
ncbi:MAG: branched-chain amino acid ABC transporter permease, partial [Thalassospira sp.]|nr:branched-chain amino acid ABC transporter permease [Thalassospira sp.]